MPNAKSTLATASTMRSQPSHTRIGGSGADKTRRSHHFLLRIDFRAMVRCNAQTVLIMFAYTTQIRSMTQARGSFSLEFSP
jgi:hypothetical protein